MNIVCVICGKSIKDNTRSELVLVPIAGTQDGRNCEAQPIHLKCIEQAAKEETAFVFDRNCGLLYMKTLFNNQPERETAEDATNKS